MKSDDIPWKKSSTEEFDDIIKENEVSIISQYMAMLERESEELVSQRLRMEARLARLEEELVQSEERLRETVKKAQKILSTFANFIHKYCTDVVFTDELKEYLGYTKELENLVNTESYSMTADNSIVKNILRTTTFEKMLDVFTSYVRPKLEEWDLAEIKSSSTPTKK